MRGKAQRKPARDISFVDKPEKIGCHGNVPRGIEKLI